MRRARILYLITKAELGGAQVHVAELINAFRREFDVFLGTGQDGFLVKEVQKLGVPVLILKHLVHPIRPWKDIKALIEASAIMRTLRPHLVHVHTSKAGVIGRFAALYSRAKTVFTVHGWAFAEGVTWKRKLFAIPIESLAAKFTSKIVVVSHADGRLAHRYRICRPDQIVVIHNGIPDVPLRANADGGPPVRVVMVARFAPPKAHDQLLKALAAVIDRPWVLWFVGDGPTRASVEHLAHRLGISERVTFFGERTDVAELLAKGHIFVLASNWEGLPLTILEAMRAGLPIVASDVGGVREAVIDGETGFLVPRGSVEALRERLVRLIESPGLRLSMGQAGRIRYEQCFTLERMLQQTREVYQELLVGAG